MLDKNIILSILIPTVPERREQFGRLFDKINSQSVGKAVEILSFCDNRRRSIGLKRQALLDAAAGRYSAFVDDDDNVSDEYIAELYNAAKSSVHVISFRQDASWNGAKSEVQFSIQNEDEEFNPGGITKRFPWHSCAWRTDVARRAVFSDKNWGEDHDWVCQLKPLQLVEAHIPRVLHHYCHTDAASLAH